MMLAPAPPVRASRLLCGLHGTATFVAALLASRRRFGRGAKAVMLAPAPPVRGAQPLTAPAVRPAATFFWIIRKKITTGSEVIVAPAINGPHAVPRSVW
jgi:hypothetical protein